MCAFIKTGIHGEISRTELQEIDLLHLTNLFQILYSLNLFYHKALNDITNIPCVIHLTGQISIAYPASVHKAKSTSLRCSRCNLPYGLPHLCSCCMIGEKDAIKTGCHRLLRHINTIVIVRFDNHGNIVKLCCHSNQTQQLVTGFLQIFLRMRQCLMKWIYSLLYGENALKICSKCITIHFPLPTYGKHRNALLLRCLRNTYWKLSLQGLMIHLSLSRNHQICSTQLLLHLDITVDQIITLG